MTGSGDRQDVLTRRVRRLVAAALIDFGLDSAIEVASAATLAWRELGRSR